MLMPQVPLAPLPVVDGTPRFACAPAALVAPVPPLPTPTVPVTLVALVALVAFVAFVALATALLMAVPGMPLKLVPVSVGVLVHDGAPLLPKSTTLAPGAATKAVLFAPA